MNKKYISSEHPVPWRYEARIYGHENGEGYCYDVYDATNALIETYPDDEDLAKCLVEFSQSKKRNQDLALMLREIIADLSAGENRFLKSMDKADRIMNAGTEVSEYDIELQGYLNVFNGVKTRMQIDDKIKELSAELREVEHPIDRDTIRAKIGALNWVISEGNWSGAKS